MRAVAPTSTTRFLLGLIRPYGWRLFFGAVMTLVATLAMLSLPKILQRMFDSAIAHADKAALLELSGLMLLMVGVMVGGVFMRTWLITFAVNQLFVDLRQQLTDKLLSLDVAYFEGRRSGEILSRMVTDGTVVREFLVTATPIVVRGVCLTLGALLALATTSLKLTLLLLLVAGPMVWTVGALGKRLKAYSRQQQDNLAFYSGGVEEAISHFRTIASHHQQGTVGARLYGGLVRIMTISNRYNLLKATNMAVTLLLGFTALVGVVGVGGLDVMAGRLSIGQMMAFLLYLAFLADGTSNLSDFWPALQTALGASERMVELLNTQPQITEATRPARLPALGKKRARGIAFENVRFAYPARPDTWAADGVTLNIKAGQKVAIVGPSGAGKSTVLALLLRFYDVAEGSIKLDGVAIDKLRFADLRGALALVAQDAPLFSGTVAENVSFGKLGASEKEIWTALKVAHAEQFVRELPQGLATPVGERGVQLSGGQRQRIAIARAVLVDAPVLLLDEATSHLDTDSERAVQAALAAAGKGRTVVAIAHRLSTVRDADVIFVMDGGQVVASGSHEALMKSNALYRGLAALQLRA